jgi:fatty acid desaturase
MIATLGKSKGICFNKNMKIIKNKFTQNFKNTILLFGEWSLILTLIGLNSLGLHWILQILSIFLIGTRVHALGILMHEASHYNLFTNRMVNECLVKIFISLPTLVSLEGYRKTHELHHDYSQTNKDPTYTRKLGKVFFDFPKKNQWHFLKELLQILLGYGAYMALTDLKRNQGTQQKKDPLFLAITLIFYTALFAMLIKTENLLVFSKFWLLPNMTVLPLVNYWRTVAEHSALPESSNTNVRTVFYNPLLAWLITPYNINLHTEHHNRPNVKWFDLPKIYHKEKQNSGGHYTFGIFQLWREFINPVNSTRQLQVFRK